MNSWIAIWLFFRALRWLGWITLIGFSLYYLHDPSRHLNSFGQLYHSAEAVFFGCGLVGVFAGMLELMARERAGLARPSFGRLIPPPAEPETH
jgi:hypothetical protein